MQAMLEELNALEGVLGSLRCDAAGQVLARALPAEQLDADVAGAAAAVAETAAELDAAAGGVTHLDLHYAQRRVIVRPTGDGAVVLICEKSVNPKKLVPAVIEVLRRHAGPAPRATTPRAPIRSPSPPTAPAERPDLGDGSSSLPAWRRPPVLAAGVAALVLVLGAAWWLARRPGAAPAAAAATAKAGAQQATIPAVVALRIGGAKSFAAELAPALAKAYLESLQATDVKVSKQDMHRFEVRGMVGGAPWVATIEGLNTPDGFGQLSAGKLDAVLNFWNFNARLKEKGLVPLITIGEILPALGLKTSPPLLGWVFSEKWAKDHPELANGLIDASYEAKHRMKTDDALWQTLRPKMDAESDSLFEILKAGYREGIPEGYSEADVTAASDAFDLMRGYARSHHHQLSDVARDVVTDPRRHPELSSSPGMAG